MDTDFHKIKNRDGVIINEDKSIEIREHVWIGCRSTILKGSHVPSNSIVAACSTISNRNTKENSIYTSGGKVLKEGVVWEE